MGCIPDVNVIADFEALQVLGFTLENLLEPFTNINLSLSEQVIHLSCFAHLLYTLYRDQRRRFMPNQLYYDSQTMVKNAVFSIAKQQKLNPSSSFSLLDVGDDALELTFALLRMSGGHNNAFNYRQTIDRLCAVRDIGDIYSRNPDIRHGHRRLNMNRKESVDHISRATWVGDTIAGNCDLPTCWSQGRENAVELLQKSKVPPPSYDFGTLFSPGSGIDMLCVFGDAKYPSINDAEDHEDVDILTARVPPTVQTNIEDTQANHAEDVRESGGDEGEELDIGFDEAIENEVDSLDRDPTTSIQQPVSNTHFPTAPPSGPGVHAKDYLLCDERKWVHKQSVCRLLITPDFSPKSTVRLLHVCGYTSVNKRLSDLETGHLLHGDNFVVGDVFVSLVCTHNKALALAFIRSTHISQGGSAHGHVKIAMLMSPQGGIKVAGNIMVLRPSTSSPVSSPESLWLWTGSYLKAASMVPGTQAKTTRIVSISVAGHLLTVVNPTTATAAAHLAPDDQAEVNANDTTWALPTKALETAMAVIWSRVATLKAPLSGFPSIGHTYNSFLCQILDGMSVNSDGDHDSTN